MKKKTCRLLGIVVALAAMVLVSGQVRADQIVAKAADTSPALRVYNGFTGTVTIVVATNGEDVTVTCDGNATKLTAGTSYDTITELADGIAACTNAAGAASLRVDSNPSLLADSTDDELLDGTYTAVAGKWLELLWDTSAHLSYDLYFPSRSYQSGVSAYVLEKINCVPTGTGNVTASVYKDRVLIAQKVITSPVYVNPATWLQGYAAGTTDLTGVTTNSYTADANVTVDWIVDLPFTGSEPVIVRVSRATTATTGSISAVIK
jgi:hypothetical protein